MSTFLPAEKGTTIRMPSTANLMIDSIDRNNGFIIDVSGVPTTVNRYPLANTFQITRPNAILNGFFTRIGTTEVVLEYNTPNISSTLANNTLTIDISGAGAAQTFTAVGFFNVAELCNWVAAKLSDVSGNWSVVESESLGYPGGAVISPSSVKYVTLSGPIAEALGINDSGYFGPGNVPVDILSGFFVASGSVDLRPFRFLDFTSAQLTYNQDLKDSSTAPYPRDVLCRWYMAWDEAPAYDAYGFPILMGYAPFQLRRTFSPPKQIRWDNIQSLGNIAFEVWDNTNRLAPFNFNTNWLMTLQVSEV